MLGFAPHALRSVLVCACALATTPATAYTLSADFDHGSLDVAGSNVVGQLIHLAGRDNFNPGRWKWLYFKVDATAGQSPFFQIGDDFATGAEDLVGHKMVYSYDGAGWSFFDNHQLDTAAGRFTFWNDAPFVQDAAYVAYGIPYSEDRSRALTSTALASPWVGPAPSGDAALSIGVSPGGVDDLGREIPANPLQAFRIQDPLGPEERTKVVLASGVHANESLGNYVLEGLVDFLLGDDVQANLLRRVADFYVYPMVNPDGRAAGNNRSTIADPGVDPNRVWAAPNYGGVDEVAAVAEAMLADTGGDADYLIDFHSTVVGKTGHYGFVLPAMQSDPMWRAFLRMEPEIDTRNALLEDDTLAKFGRDALGADFSITFETQFLADENIDRFLSLGESFGRAFASTLVTFADLNSDGALDADDWTPFNMNAESDLSGLSPLDSYLHGDLNGDGVNSLADFGLFKDAYIQTHGAAAFARLVAVPEPAAACLAAVGLLTCTHPFPSRRPFLC